MNGKVDHAKGRAAPAAHADRRLRALLATVREFVYYKDLSNVIVHASDSMAYALGVPLEQIEGRSCAELFPTDAGRMHKHDLEVARTREAKRGIHERLGMPGGLRLWVRTDKTPLFDDKGEVTGILAVSEDVSEDVDLQRRIGNASGGYRLGKDETVLGVFRTDRAGRSLYASPELADFVDAGAEGFAWLESVHPSDRPQIEEILAQLPEAEPSAYHLEFRLRRKDGQLRMVSCVAAAERDDANTVTGFTGVMIDITERRFAEEEIAESHRRFETLAAITPLGMYRGDARGRTLFVNERWLELTGLTRAESANYGWRRALPEEDRNRVLSGLSAAVTQGLSFSAEHRLVHADGRLTWVIHHCVPELDSTGAVVGTLGVLTEITELKEALEENERLNNELEARVKRRTAQLEMANKELEAFCYSVSHDLRAPLRGIDGFSVSLLEDFAPQLDATARGYIGRIRDATGRMSVLIDELLSLSRLTSSKLSYDQVDLSEMVRDVAADLAQIDPARRVRFDVEEGVAVYADRELMRSVLQNLLGNAWKFTAKRTDAVIEFGSRKHEGSSRSFYVRDNGAGFDMARSAKLFRAFERLHSKEDFEGTGIGLATVDRIIKRHGGRVWAEAAPGEGATFHFTVGALSDTD